MKNIINISNFDFEDLEGLPMPSYIKNDYKLAKELADFIYGAHIRYNVIYSQNQDTEQLEYWNNWIDNFDAGALRFEEIMIRINCKGQLRSF